MIVCKDCGAEANSKNTMRASEYGTVGPDLHFCDPCEGRKSRMLDILLKGIQEGKVTVEQMEIEIAKHLPS